MISWLYPIALIGVVAIVGPIAVHLLRRQRAQRLAFPSLRFVAAARTSSFRTRLPSDVPLMLLRVAIVGSAAVALAQPLLVTGARRHAWNGRLNRAIVVDQAVSAAQQANDAAGAELQTADAQRITDSSLRNGLRAAVDALSATGPSRREIVVISDFRLGTIGPADIAAVPAQMGLRFVRVDVSPPAADFDGDTTLGAPGVSARVQRIRATSEGTAAELKNISDPRGGLRIETLPDRAEMLRRAVARAGAPAPDPREPITLAFKAGSEIRERPKDSLAPWMLRTLLRMRRDPLLVEAAGAHVRNAAAAALPGIVIVRDPTGAPVVSAMQRGPEFVVLLASAPGDFVSAAALQSALVARRGEPRWPEHEVVRIPASALAAWTRVPAMVDSTDARPLPPGDARWMWGIVLALLAVETFVRKRRDHALESGYATAA